VWLRASIDEHLFMPQHAELKRVEAQAIYRIEHLCGPLIELRRYLVANRRSLTSRGKEAGERDEVKIGLSIAPVGLH